MATIESAPQTTPEVVLVFRDKEEDVVLRIDALQHDAGFDSSGPVSEKLALFEDLVKDEVTRSESSTVAIIAGNAALTLAAAMEAVDAGAEEIQLVDPYNGNSVSFGPEGTVLGAEGAGTIEISLGSHAQLPAGVEVIPVNFTDEGVDKDALTPVSMANTIGVVPDDPNKVPDIRFTGQLGELSELSIVHFDSGNPMLGVVAGGVRWANLRRRGLVRGSVEVVSGGGPRQFNRVIAGSTDRLAKVHIGDIAYGGGD